MGLNYVYFDEIYLFGFNNTVIDLTQFSACDNGMIMRQF